MDRLTVRDLRRQWKPIKERLSRASKNGDIHPLPIRMHRAFSWLLAVEGLNDEVHLDQRIVFRWISLNALYGIWDEQQEDVVRDSISLHDFCSKIMSRDRDQCISEVLRFEKENVLAILGDRFTNRNFWQKVLKSQAFREDYTYQKGLAWYAEEEWNKILKTVVSRIYLVRCQLVHGAATHGSKQNRDMLTRCDHVLHQLLLAFLLVIIEQAWQADWGQLCYPPIAE